MAIKDKFADASKETAGEIDVLPITDIQTEFPNLASNNSAKENLSMSEYGYAIGTSPGQQVKFSDMFGISNYTKVKFIPGEKRDYYSVKFGSIPGVKQSLQVGLNPGRNYLHSDKGHYTTSTSSKDNLDRIQPGSIIDNSNINAKIPGYNRCDVLCFDIKGNSTYNRYHTDRTLNVYNDRIPDVRLFIKSYDEYPIFGEEARDSNFPMYDPHWNWMKLTGKFYSRTSTQHDPSNTLDSYEKSFYFHRNAAEVKWAGSFNPRDSSYKKYTPADVGDFGKLIHFAKMGSGGDYYPHGNQYYEAKEGSWDAPQTISDVGDNVKAVHGSSYWGSGGEQSIGGQFFFNPGNGSNLSQHDDKGGSGVHAYVWQMPYDGEIGDPRNSTAEYRPMWGNASNRVFGYHEMSKAVDEPDNAYTIEFLVNHPNSYYDSFYGDMERIGGTNDPWQFP